MSSFESATVRLAAEDNVITAIRKLEAGESIDGITTRDPVPRGHKMATRPIAIDEPVVKYGQRVGYASLPIEPGDHVHTHNVGFKNTSHDYEFCLDAKPAQPAGESARATFMGYRRHSGRAGTRNYIAVLTSVNCSATAARLIAQAFGPDRLADFPNVDGVVAFSHATGCGMDPNGEGFDALQRVIAGYARHPNVAGVLLVGLGCEDNQVAPFMQRFGLEPGPLLRAMTIQSIGGLRKTVELGIERVESMLPLANEVTRVECPASDIALALQCGGSDAWSGITANPSLGHAVDLLAHQGAAAVLAETPEIYGAEHLLTRRSVDRATGQKLVERITWWEDYVVRNRGSMDNNPSPGNKRGGITTILEKSLGAVAKGGTTALNGVYQYAEPIDRSGFLFMDSPGFDPAAVTGQIASGCNIVAFTTGRGSAFGCKPAPSIKIATNTELFERMPEDMDVNAGRIISTGASVEEVGREILDLLLRVASGEPSLSEAQGLGDYEFVPWQIGATM